jgi:hypothetical protein
MLCHHKFSRCGVPVLLRSCPLIPLVLAEALVEQSAVLSSLRWVSCHLANWNVPGGQNLHGEKN